MAANAFARFMCYYLCNTTADKSNNSAAGMLHPQCNATRVLYVTLCCPIPPLQKSNFPFLTGNINPKVPIEAMEKQESLANAKVNARQHCVVRSH